MLFSDEDLEAAGKAGVLTAETAAALRGFIENRRATPAVDEESFRLLTGFNDIFVSIALVISLFALDWLVASVSQTLADASVAAISWALAEFFTRKRRMALPSILLVGAFVFSASILIGDFLLLLSHIIAFHPKAPVIRIALGVAGVLAAFVHWKRFRVPITVAASALMLVINGVKILNIVSPNTMLLPLFMMGLVIFALAVAWDISDRERKTRRADVAFWLHLLAAPLIVHSFFTLLGMNEVWSLFYDVQIIQAPPQAMFHIGLVLAVYAVLTLIALALDRRAFMVSGLAYFIYAVYLALRATGHAPTMNFAASALIVGGILLVLSAFWAGARHCVLRFVPARLRNHLPPVDIC